MDKESDRPTRVEVGSTWAWSGGEFVVLAAGEGLDGVVSTRITKATHAYPWRVHDLLEGYGGCRLLAPAPGSRQAERRVMAVDARGNPASCLSCGAEKGVELLWFCSRCLHDSKIKCYELVAAWKEGARDFPRSTQSEPAPTAPHDQTLCTYCQGGIACPEFARMFKAGNVSVIAPTSTPRAAVPPKPLDRCTWNTQAAPGMLTGRCTSLVSHAKSPYCETHIFEAMEARRKPAPVEQPRHFHQSHPLIAGGVISLRAGRGGR